MSPKSTSKEADSKSAGDEDANIKGKKVEGLAPIPEEELNEEDRKLKEELELCVTRLQEDDPALYKGALESLRKLIRASTTSMTSVPKPLKFMIPHYDAMRSVYDKIAKHLVDQEVRKECADILSVLSMTMGGGGSVPIAKVGPTEKEQDKESSLPPEQPKTNRNNHLNKNECLRYKLLGNWTTEDLDSWGHEYVRHLAGEVVAEWNEITAAIAFGQSQDKESKDDEHMDTSDEGSLESKKNTLIRLVEHIVPSQMKHHAEAEACDLLMEVEKLEILDQYVDKSTFNRVCLYLTSCVSFVPEPENTSLLYAALRLFRKFEKFPQALRVALQINNTELVQEIFLDCKDPIVQKQMAFMLGRHQHFLEDLDEGEFDEVNEIMSNSHLNNHFLNLARELDIMEPKTPEDVYKSHLDNIRPVFGVGGSGGVDSARQNLASSFVNGFVNAGFSQDKLLLLDDPKKFLSKNKEHGLMSTMASLGLVLLWDVESGLSQIDKYLYSKDDYVKAGALLACGITTTGVRNECAPALALLSDYVLHSNNQIRLGAIFGLGLAHAGSNHTAVISCLLKVFSDPSSSMEVVGVAALSCGLVCVGSCNNDVTTTILQTLMEKSDLELRGDPFAKFLPLGIGLCYLGKQEAAEATIATLEVLNEPFKSMAMTLVEICAYAGTGNVLKVQSLLHICSEHYELHHHHHQDKEDAMASKKDKKKETTAEKKKAEQDDKDKEAAAKDLSMQQSVAVLGLALIAMGEDIGCEMLFRHFGHLLRYCEPVIRRAVPLALGLISVSNPQLNILDTLSKFSHDADSEVAHNAIFAMGLIGAGTNNARLAAMLRQLAQYHSKDSNNLFMVRIAQGLIHMGKGTLTLNPYHSDNQLMSPVAVAGLLGCIVSFLDVKSTILGKSHYLLYSLVTAISPRMLVTFDEELNPLPVSVRVGQAVDVVGQAGKPKTITGFQTHTTPVLLSHGERAELATEEYLPITPILEGFVILKKNPDYE